MAVRDRELGQSKTRLRKAGAFGVSERRSGRALPRIITIDGPSAAGKSSVGHRLAQRLGYAYLDTGAMYRGITWLALERGVDPEDGPALAALAGQAKLEVGPPPPGADESSVQVEGRDITPLLRGTAVERAVSLVSRVPAVRQALVELQRHIAADGPVVVTGRDIGTVVLPRADLKVYLDASLEERARRRYLEVKAMSRRTTLSAVLAEMRRRDSIDQGRATAPLRAAPDAVVINTDGLALEQVVERILALMGVPA